MVFIRFIRRMFQRPPLVVVEDDVPEQAERPPVNYGRVLTPDEVREIRRRRAAGTKLRVLAADFGLSVNGISLVCRHRTYADVDED